MKKGNGKKLRKLHDTVQQYIRALKAMDCEPSGPFITSVVELKLDTMTMFKWQKHSQDATSVPHYQDLLDFMNLHAHASETSSSESRKPSKNEVRKNFQSTKQVMSFATNSDTFEIQVCVLCKPEIHLLFNCNKFKELHHDGKLCHNCLRAGH